MTDAAMTRTSTGLHVSGRAHDILLVALIALRPLIWSGDAGAWDNLAWLMLSLVALVWLVIDAWRGRMSAWRFGLGGVIAAGLLLILLPAALRSPYPSTGMGLWGMAVIHLGFAAYLMQAIPGRERLAFGALIGALVVECLVAFGQWAWVLPGMAKALAGGDPTIAALETTSGDLANRVAYGGLFGTFTLANTLAAFLVLAAVPLIGVAWQAGGRGRLIASGVLLLSLVVALGTASKGAAVALLIGAGVVWIVHRHDRWRWLPVPLAVFAAVVLALVPAIRDLGAASAHVRLGYWQGATALIAERPLIGHGLQGFAAHGSRTMPLDAEPTRHVHNDVLEATVDGGVLAGLALALLLLCCARPRMTTPELAASIVDPSSIWRSTWPMLLILPLFCALGMLASNVEWWPLGAGESTWWLWPLVLSAVLIGVAMVSTHLPLPPAWAWQLALVAFALHCLVDFNLQSPAIWGTLIVVAVLAGGRVYAIGVCPISRSGVLLLVFLCLAGFLFGVRRGAQLNIASRYLPDERMREQPGATPAPDREIFVLMALELGSRWPMDSELVVTALRQFTPGERRITYCSHARKNQPWNPQLNELLAQDLLAVGDQNAFEPLQTAVELNPAYLPRRLRLVELYERAAALSPERREQLKQLAQSERQRIAELVPIVHPRNRLHKPPASGLPIQPAP
jgi:hypothetical protein